MEKTQLNDDTQLKKGEKKEKLASALRENLKRRKAAPRPKKPAQGTEKAE